MFPSKVPSSIPAAPISHTAKKSTLNPIVEAADTKLPKAYETLFPSPLAICRNKEEKMDAITFAARKCKKRF